MRYEDARDVLKAVPETALYGGLDEAAQDVRDAALLVALTTLRAYRLDSAERGGGCCQGEFYTDAHKLLSPFLFVG